MARVAWRPKVRPDNGALRLVIDGDFMDRFDAIFKAIAYKATRDPALAEDCVQETYLALMAVDCTRIHSNPEAFVRMVARNTMLSMLDSHTKGNWYTKRQGRERSRFVRMDRLIGSGLLQLAEDGQLLPGETGEGDSYYYTQILDEGGMAVTLPL